MSETAAQEQAADIPAWGTIGVLAGIQMVYTEFATALAGLAITTQAAAQRQLNRRVAFMAYTSCYVVDGRNWLSENMHGDWLFQTDTDHAFEPDLLIRMLQTMYGPTAEDPPRAPLGVVSALYFGRGHHRPHIYAWRTDDDGNVLPIATPIMDIPEGRVMQVGACGAGALLVQRGVFEHMRMELGNDPFAPTDGGLQDDLAFCWRCRQLGIPIHCDTSCVSEHLETHRVNRSDYETTREELEHDGDQNTAAE